MAVGTRVALRVRHVRGEHGIAIGRTTGTVVPGAACTAAVVATTAATAKAPGGTTADSQRTPVRTRSSRNLRTPRRRAVPAGLARQTATIARATGVDGEIRAVATAAASDKQPCAECRRCSYVGRSTTRTTGSIQPRRAASRGVTTTVEAASLAARGVARPVVTRQTSPTNIYA